MNTVNIQIPSLVENIRIVESFIDNAKEQFNLLITYIIPQIQHRINIKYDYPEWEFPKGTRTNNETNLECAIRNFKEETGLKCDKYTILDRLYPLIEIKQGLDGINYKHIYYIAVLNNNLSKIDLVIGAKGTPLQLVLASVLHLDNPTGNISYDEAKNIIRNGRFT